MLYYTPVPISEHAELLGPDFNERFSDEMSEYYGPFIKKGRRIQLAKETWEYAVADSIINGIWVGAGNNVIDVETLDIQIDVKGLSCLTLNSITTEASILQNLKLESDNVVKLFETNDFDGLKTMFVDSLFEKIKNCDNLYVFCAVREKETQLVHYCLLKVNEKENDNFVNEMAVIGKRSVSIPLIDPKYGKTYLCIPKRRLELRLKMDGIQEFCVAAHIR